MSRTQITRDDPLQYSLLLELLKQVPGLLMPEGFIRVPEGRGWIVTSSIHPPRFEFEVWAVDEAGELIEENGGRDLKVEPALRTLVLPSGFPLPDGL